MDDRELLKEYVTERSETAFAALVERYLGLVFSAARRQLGNDAAAEEVCQTVFLLLSRKAVGIRTEQALAGWLYKTACFQAARFRRSEERRRKREQEALHMSETTNGEPDPWERVVPHLDPAMSALREADRELVLLRFFQRKPLARIGQIFGISEDAARMRVNRALDRLRGILVSKGALASAAALGELLLDHAVEAAAPTLLSRLTSTPRISTVSTGDHTYSFFLRLAGGGAVFFLVFVGVISFGMRRPESNRTFDSDPQPIVSPGIVEPVFAPLKSSPATMFSDTRLERLLTILYSPIDEGHYPSNELRDCLDALKPDLGDVVPLLLEAMVENDRQRKLNYLPQARAISGLGYLGPAAASAVPELLAHVRTPGGQHKDMMLRYALPRMRPEPQFASELVELYRTSSAVPASLTPAGHVSPRDELMREFVWESIGTLVRKLGPNQAGEVRRLLETLLADLDPDIGLLAASSMAFFPDPSPKAVAMLTADLEASHSAADSLRRLLALQALRNFGTNAASAAPVLTALLKRKISESERTLARETLGAVSARPEAHDVKKLSKDASVSELAAALSAPATRVQAARRLGALGPAATAALPQLYEALRVEDDVFRQLLVLVIKQVAPDRPRPLFSQQDLAMPLRAVVESVSSDQVMTREINRDLAGAMFYDHSFILDLVEKLERTEPKMRKIFVAELLKVEPLFDLPQKYRNE